MRVKVMAGEPASDADLWTRGHVRFRGGVIPYVIKRSRFQKNVDAVMIGSKTEVENMHI